MRAVIPLSREHIYTPEAIESLRKQIGSVLPLKAKGETVGVATIVDVLEQDGLALVIESDDYGESTLSHLVDLAPYNQISIRK